MRACSPDLVDTCIRISELTRKQRFLTMLPRYSIGGVQAQATTATVRPILRRV